MTSGDRRVSQKAGMMNGAFYVLRIISKLLNFIAGIALTFMMLLTVVDVLFRAGGHPLIGAYEIVALSMGIVIGFGIPQSSLNRSHVYMEFLVEKFSKRGKNIMNTFTRVLCFILFAFIGYNLFNVAAGFKASGEVSATMQLPFYPVAYGIAVCCLLECCVFIYEIVKIWRGEYE